MIHHLCRGYNHRVGVSCEHQMGLVIPTRFYIFFNLCFLSDDVQAAPDISITKKTATNTEYATCSEYFGS